MELSRGKLLLYGANGFPLALLGLPLYVYLPTFYAVEMGLGLAVTGGILLLVRLFDLISDPLIGLFSDRLAHFGNPRRLAMWLGAPLLLLGVEMLFRPAASVGSGYLLMWSMLTFLGWTLVTIPYTAWGAELSPSIHQRSRVAASREGFVILGTTTVLLVPLLPGIVPEQRDMLALLATLVWISLPLTLLLCSLLSERVTDAGRQNWREGLTALYRNQPLQRLLSIYLLNNIANALPATLFLLFVTHRLQTPEWIAPLLGVYFLSGLLGLPLWLAIARRRGKQFAWGLSMLLASIAFTGVPLLGPGDTTAFLLICLVSGLSLGADMALPASIQADVLDLDRQLSGSQRAGLLFGIWGMLTKLSLALAVGIAFPLLALTGFDSSPAASPPAALMTLSLLYGVLPILLKLGALKLLRGFNLTLRGESHETLPAAASAAARRTAPERV